jgi:hypothetical protein
MANQTRRWGKGTDRRSVATFKPVALGSVLEPTRSSRAQRRVHGGAAFETKRSGLKFPDDELSSGIKNPAKHDNIARFLEEAEKQERLAKELEDLKIAEGER